MAGLTEDGFTVKTIDEIIEEVSAVMRVRFGASIDLTDASIEGQIIRIMAEREAAIWEEMQKVHSSMDPDKATGSSLEAVSLFTGTYRRAASYSTVSLTFTGTHGSSIPAGSRAAVTSTGDEFVTVDSCGLTDLTAWANTTAFVVDDRVSNGGNSYVCIEAGTSAGSGGPTTESDDITDGTVHWRFMGNGTAVGDALARADETGGIVATSGDITTIVTPIGGLDSVINLLDADLGDDEMSDENLRQLREFELGLQGSTTERALRAEVGRVSGVFAVTVFTNRTSLEDADGLPPHSVEVMVRGGDDDAIFQQVFDSVAAGVGTFGNQDGTAEDELGVEHDVSFSRPVEVPIYVDMTVVKDPDVYPADGDEQIKAAIVEYGDAQATGKNAVASRLVAAAFTIPGVLEATALIDDAPTPLTNTTIPISSRQLAVFDTSRVAVTSSDGTP